MKKFIILCVVLFSGITTITYSQKINTNLKMSIPQNQVFNLDKKDKILTTNTAIYKDKIYPVYATSNGKLYIELVSKTNKIYKKYLK